MMHHVPRTKVSTRRLRQVEDYINDMHRPSLGGLSANQREQELRHDR